MFPKTPGGWFALASLVFIIAVIAIIVVNV